MIHVTSLHDALRSALDAEGLLPPLARYDGARARIAGDGEAERDWLIGHLGRRVWSRGLRALARPQPEEDAIRVLGFGRALTAFAVAPARAPTADLPSILHLGALTNFLVATFDHFFDHGQPAAALIPRWFLTAAARAPSSLPARLAAVMGAPRRVLLCRLVLEYFNTLQGIVPPEGADLYHTCVRTIVRMYDAEVASLRPTTPQEHLRNMRRKNALPFVVMGLPAWLVAPRPDPVLQRRHLSWLCRLGSFLGGVDDIVDLAEDALADRPNRVGAALGCGHHTATLVRRLAAGGRRVVDQWAALSPAGADEVHGLRVCLASWLGGMAP